MYLVSKQKAEQVSIDEEVLRCGRCFDVLNNTPQKPKYLKCLHAFCGNCLPNILTGDCVCPVCKCSIELQRGTGVGSLPDVDFLENKEKFERILKEFGPSWEGGDTRIECRNCADGNVATHWSEDLNIPLLFCSECVSVHDKFKTSTHSVFRSLRNTRREDILPHVQKRPRNTKCPKHNKDLRLFCEVCLTVVCPECHSTGHPLVQLKEQAESIRDRIGAKLQDSTETKEILGRRLKHIENEQERLAECGDLTVQQISSFCNELRQCIGKREKQLQDQLASIVRTKSKILEDDAIKTRSKLQDVTYLTAFVSAAKKHSTDRDLMTMGESLNSRLPDVLPAFVSDEPDDNGVVTFDVGTFNQIRSPEIGLHKFTDILKKVPSMVTQLGDIKGTTTSASMSKFAILEKGSGLEIAIEAFGKKEERCSSGGDSFCIEICDPQGNIITPIVVDSNTGTYRANFDPQLEGKYYVNINFLGRPICGSPYKFEMEDKYTRNSRSSIYMNYVGKPFEPSREDEVFPDRAPPPPPVPLTPRPASTGYMTMGNNRVSSQTLRGPPTGGRLDRPLHRARTTSDILPERECNIGICQDDVGIERYQGKRRGSRCESYIYQTIDSLGLNVKEEGPVAEKKIEALHDKFKTKTKGKSRKISLPSRWKKS